MLNKKLLILGMLVFWNAGCSGCDDTATGGAGIGEACVLEEDCAEGLVCTDGLCAEPSTEPRDTDNDGIPDSEDNCPDIPNPLQEDSDNNGIGDACEPPSGDDRDGDGVRDSEDNCPDEPNPSQSDVDGDGIGDACDPDADDDGTLNEDDNCPLVPNPGQEDQDGDGQGDVCDDSDGDGVLDNEDNCPDVSNPNQSDQDGDGIGDACDDDRDGDGVINTNDNCPDVENPEQEDTDEDGVGDACDPDTTRREGRPFDDTCIYGAPIGVFEPELKWSLGIGANDPYPDRTQVMMTPVVANLTDDDADGVIGTRDTPDIIYGTFSTFVKASHDDLRRGVLRAASGDGTGLLWSVGADELGIGSGGGINPGGNIAVGDIDNDGFVEIIASVWSDTAETGGLVAVSHDGQVLWMTSYSRNGLLQPRQFKSWWGGPSIADLDGDGNPEIIMGATVFTNTGDLKWDAATSATLTGPMGEGINWPNGDSTRTTYTGPLSVVADLDGVTDPTLNRKTQEVVTGRTAYKHDGTVLWEADANLPDGFPAIGDFNGDGDPEVVVAANGDIRIHDGLTGALVWGPVDLEAGRLGAPTVADLTGDGNPEIGVAGQREFFALTVNLNTPNPTLNQAVLWSNVTQDASSSMTGSSVFDFEGDGKAELVYNDELYLRVYDGTTGDVLFEQPNTSYTAVEYPIIVDVNNDGAANIVVGTNDFECDDVLPCPKGFSGIRVFGDDNDNWVSTRRIWNQHSYHINNVNEDGSIPSQETPSWVDHNTYRLNRQTELDPQAAPDLILEEPQGLFDACTGTLTTWVTNAGAVRVGAGLPVSFYGNDGSGLQYLGQALTQLPLEPGDSERVRFNVTLDNPGPWSFFAVADDLMGAGAPGTQNECNEDNNQILVPAVTDCQP
jgi:hypothetical protein